MNKQKIKSTRTILEFLWKLPEPYQSQAIKNAGDRAYQDFVGRTIKDALMSAFSWSSSPEGGEYWNNFKNNYLL